MKKNFIALEIALAADLGDGSTRVEFVPREKDGCRFVEVFAAETDHTKELTAGDLRGMRDALDEMLRWVERMPEAAK